MFVSVFGVKFKYMQYVYMLICIKAYLNIFYLSLDVKNTIYFCL